MTFLVERVAQLRRHLDHLRSLRGRGVTAERLRGDMSLANDVLHSLQSVCQLIIDVAGELASRRADRFENYREAITLLRHDPRFPEDVVAALERVPGFRNAIVHDYVALDLKLVVDALNDIEPAERFADIVASIEASKR
jgi:uncharacterized protein YutE (UPF0331/DUF86 family)